MKKIIQLRVDFYSYKKNNAVYLKSSVKHILLYFVNYYLTQDVMI